MSRKTLPEWGDFQFKFFLDGHEQLRDVQFVKVLPQWGVGLYVSFEMSFEQIQDTLFNSAAQVIV